MVPHIAYLHRNTHTRYCGKLAISATHKQKRKNKKHHQIPMKLNWKTSERAMSTYNQKHRTKKLIFIKSVRLSRKKPAREQKKVTGEPDQPSLCGRKKKHQAIEKKPKAHQIPPSFPADSENRVAKATTNSNTVK
jgi:hypothetical protein